MNIIEDIDSHKLIKTSKLDTHETKTRKTHLIIRVMYPDYWNSEWHREILKNNGHNPEPSYYSSKFEDKHCEKCWNNLSEDEKQEHLDYCDVDDDGNYIMEAYCCEAESFHVEILAVNPGIQRKETIEEIEQEFDISWKDLDEDAKISILCDRGIAATLWQDSGDNEEKLLEKAKEELKVIETLAGFYLDRPQNAIGSTGWDFMKGDILGGLNA